MIFLLIKNFGYRPFSQIFNEKDTQLGFDQGFFEKSSNEKDRSKKAIEFKDRSKNMIELDRIQRSIKNYDQIGSNYSSIKKSDRIRTELK